MWWRLPERKWFFTNNLVESYKYNCDCLYTSASIKLHLRWMIEIYEWECNGPGEILKNGEKQKKVEANRESYCVAQSNIGMNNPIP